MRSIPRSCAAAFNARIHLVVPKRNIALCGEQPRDGADWSEPAAQATCARCLALQEVLDQVAAAAPAPYRNPAVRQRLGQLTRLALLDHSADGWTLRKPAAGPFAVDQAPKHEPLTASDWVSFRLSPRARRLTGTVVSTSLQVEVQDEVVQVRHRDSGRLFAVPRTLVSKLGAKAVEDTKDRLRTRERPPRPRSSPSPPSFPAPANPAPVVGEALHLVPMTSPLRFVPKAPPPVRSTVYLDFVRRWCCLICDDPARPVDAHHVGRQPIGQKVSDLFAVPLCRRCHDHLHATGCLAGYTPEDTHALLRGAMVVLLAEWHEELMRLISPPTAGALSPEERAYVEYLSTAEVVHAHA